MSETPKERRVRGAPEWLLKQREAQRKHQAEHPLTEEQVREYWNADRAYCDPNYPYKKGKKPAKARFFPVWSTHRTASEGGRKTHLVEASHVDRCRSGIRALCKRMISLANTGDAIPDVEAWAKDSANEICKLCYYRATNRMPVRGLVKGPFNE